MVNNVSPLCNSDPLKFGVATAKLGESDEYRAVAAVILLRIALHMSELEESASRWRFVELMDQCKNVAIRILETPDGKLADSLLDLLKFPFQIEMVLVERQAQLAQNKLEKLKLWLDRIAWKGGTAPILQTAIQPSPAATAGGSSAPAPIMQTANQQSPAVTTGGSSAPVSNLQTAHRTTSCPLQPREMKAV